MPPPAEQAARPKFRAEPTRRSLPDVISPQFLRLVRVHTLSAAGDAMITIALAGSLFFSIDPSAARVRVTLYLVLTMAPFAVVGPLIGPALDRFRGGRRRMIIAINAARAFCAFLMISNIDSLMLFPVAFAMLVLQKSYGVTKASMVPLTVRNEEQLVGGNSRLALVGSLSGFIGAGPALLVNLLGGASWVVALAMVVYVLCALASLRLPRSEAPSNQAEHHEPSRLEGTGIPRAASATGALRGIVGFMTFLAAFAFRGGADDINLSGVGKAFGAGVRHALQGDVASEASPVWKLGLVAVATVCGFLAGSLLAPRLRERFREETVIVTALIVLFVVGLVAAWGGGFGSTLLLAMGVGATASVGKLAFDSIVQRDAEGANHGRVFAAFETRFQLFWVMGALIPVIIPIPARLGFFLIALAAAVAGVKLWMGPGSSGAGRFGPAIGRVRQPRPE